MYRDGMMFTSVDSRPSRQVNQGLSNATSFPANLTASKYTWDDHELRRGKTSGSSSYPSWGLQRGEVRRLGCTAVLGTSPFGGFPALSQVKDGN